MQPRTRLNKTRSLKLFILSIRNSQNKLTISFTDLAAHLATTRRGAIALVERLQKAGVLLVIKAVNKPNTYSLHTTEEAAAKLSKLI